MCDPTRVAVCEDVLTICLDFKWYVDLVDRTIGIVLKETKTWKHAC